jgi:phospholipid/cholesterol/gamma-HCH transport system permease protein
VTATAPIAWLGAFALRVARFTGALGLVIGRTLLHLPRLDVREFARTLVLFGYRSLPLTLGIATLAGAIVVLQAGVYAAKFGLRLYVGWAAGYAILWEFGPLMLGLVMAARIGARNAAELALLEVNGQLEGLRGISLDPFRLLVAPRVVSSALAVLGLSTVTFLVSIAWEAIASYFLVKIPLRVFFGAFSELLSMKDILAGMTKSLGFGIAIALLSTVAGLQAQGGARGVGRAAATAVVYSCFAIFFLDWLITPWVARWFG